MYDNEKVNSLIDLNPDIGLGLENDRFLAPELCSIQLLPLLLDAEVVEVSHAEAVALVLPQAFSPLDYFYWYPRIFNFQP